jgi:hypothetical protein
LRFQGGPAIGSLPDSRGTSGAIVAVLVLDVRQAETSVANGSDRQGDRAGVVRSERLQECDQRAIDLIRVGQVGGVRPAFDAD